MLPPGRARLATAPASTAFPMAATTMGTLGGQAIATGFTSALLRLMMHPRSAEAGRSRRRAAGG